MTPIRHPYASIGGHTRPRVQIAINCFLTAFFTTINGPCVTSAATYHVSPSGSNTPPYDTYAKAATDPRDAVMASSGYGDTVMIHAGEYDVDTAITLPKGLSVEGVARDSSKLIWVGPYEPIPRSILTLLGDHSVRNLSLVNSYDSQVQGVTGVRMTASTGVQMVADCLFEQTQVSGTSGDSIEIVNCEFIVGGGGGGRGITMGAAAVEPKVVWFHHNTIIADNVASEHGIRASAVSIDTVIIENNVIDFTGVQFGGNLLSCDYGAHPLLVRNNLLINGVTAFYWNYTHGVVENNTVIGGGTQQFPWSIDAELDYFQRLVIRNNVFFDTREIPRFTVCTSCGQGARINYLYNAFWPPVDSFYLTELPAGYLTVVDSANFNAYPMFADDSLYRLQAGSPLINTGDPAVLDVDGSRSDVGWTGGPFGLGYEYPELAPLPPDSIYVGGSGNLVNLAWLSRPETDLSEYRLYRDENAGFWHPNLTPHRTLAATDTTTVDTLLSAGDSYFYVVTAVDTAGLESGPSPEGSYVTSGIFDDPGTVPIPRTPFITRVYPNPFNAATTMEVYIPDIGATPAPVRVALYDITGRRIAIAYEGRLSPGQHQIGIDGVDESGRALASGVYIARLRVWRSEFGGTKLVVIK